MVYLIHFAQPFKHARHYLGYARNVSARVAQHELGRGARLLHVVTEAGIAWEVVRIWVDGDRSFERHLKNQKHAWRLCPVCRRSRKSGDWRKKRRVAAAG